MDQNDRMQKLKRFVRRPAQIHDLGVNRFIFKDKKT